MQTLYYDNILLKAIDKLSNKGFTFVKKEGFKITFINPEESIICEVKTTDLEKPKFQFIYTNSEMCGYLASGYYDNVFNEGLFEQVLIEFSETVEVLGNYYV